MFSAAVEGFRLAFDRFGSPGRTSVVLLHGWPPFALTCATSGITDRYFADFTVHSHHSAGHFTPLECAGEFAGLVRGFLGQTPD
jgi:pimeloyl-ACP methyl ester carboxylesterase